MNGVTNGPTPALPTVGVDIGGTTTRIAVFPDPGVSPDCDVLTSFPTKPVYDEQVAEIAAALAQAPAHVGIGVSFGGRITRDGAGVAVAPNLRSYEGRALAADLASRAGGPVRLAHDPICGLLAERRFGALRSADRCAYLTLSTGTGAAIQLGNGSSALTLSIEIGHQILAGNTRHCLCGQVGCLETYTGGKQLALRYGCPLEEIAEEIAEATVWKELRDALAVGLVNLAQLTRVEVVALGGAIALHHPTLLGEIQYRIDKRLHGMALELRQATLGERAPLVGAALLPSTPEAMLLH
jgi:glucokinase